MVHLCVARLGNGPVFAVGGPRASLSIWARALGRSARGQRGAPWFQGRLLSRCSDRADFGSGHLGVDEEAERVLQLVPLHQPVEGLLAQLPVIAFDLTVARVHASLWADLAKRGAVVGERDLMIGATAIAKNYAVATRDERSFTKIPGLSVQLI